MIVFPAVFKFADKTGKARRRVWETRDKAGKAAAGKVAIIQKRQDSETGGSSKLMLSGEQNAVILTEEYSKTDQTKHRSGSVSCRIGTQVLLRSKSKM